MYIGSGGSINGDTSDIYIYDMQDLNLVTYDTEASISINGN